MSCHTLPYDRLYASWKIADPGASGTFEPVSNGDAIVAITTAAAESRTIPAPLKENQRFTAYLDTDGGNCTIAVTSGQGVSSVVLDDAGDWFTLKAISVGGTVKWVVEASSGSLSGISVSTPSLTVTSITASTSATVTTADSLTVGGVIVPQAIEVSYIGQTTESATDRAFFIANRAYQVVGIRQVHAVAAGGTSKLQVTKDTSTDAPGAGTDLLTNNTNTGFDLNATANTVQTGTLTGTTASLQLAAGDRLSLDFGHTIQSTAGLVVTVQLKPI